MSRRLRLVFADAEAFAAAYQRDIARGGAFVPSTLPAELRDIVEVELELAFCGKTLVLEAEVVHRLGPEEAGSGAAGMAVQFLADAPELRRRLEPFLAAGSGLGRPAAPAGSVPSADFAEPPERLAAEERGSAPSHPDAEAELDPRQALFDPAPRRLGPEADPLCDLPDRRRAARAPAHLPARLEASHVSLRGVTRDLSEAGTLVSTDGNELPVGKTVSLHLRHPESGEEVEVLGRVTRQVEAEGTVAAVAVAFDEEVTSSEHWASFVREAKEAEADRIATGISGVIEELGMANLVQMLGNSSQLGTLTAVHGAEEGVLAFEAGTLRYVRLGNLRGAKALARMLAWTEGRFHFHAHVDALDEEDEPCPLDAAILEAVRRIDEASRDEGEALAPGGTFRIDRELLAGESQLSKTEEAVLDLAAAGFSVRRMLDVIPESDADVRRTLRELLDRGILVPFA